MSKWEPFEVDGIVYDPAVGARQDTSGGARLSPSEIPPIDPYECLCGTGFVCTAHPTGETQ